MRKGGKAVRLLMPGPSTLRYVARIRRAGLFDPVHYQAQIAGLNWLCRAFPMRHYVLWGERMGLEPHPDFSPGAYLGLNPDVAEAGLPPLHHFLTLGRGEGRGTRAQPVESLPPIRTTIPRFDPRRPRARFAIHLHLYYPDLWPEFSERLDRLDLSFDLYVTLTWRGPETEWLADIIREAHPRAQVFPVANRGRDILPFLRLLNAGAFDGYEAICKLHGKKSPHRDDGDAWRRHLVDGVLPGKALWTSLSAFLADEDAALWVADGQRYSVRKWWGSNRARTDALLRRVELDRSDTDFDFPAGSMYWMKPLLLGMIRALDLTEDLFEPESGQTDGTLAHAFERAIGALAKAAGQEVRQTSELGRAVAPVLRTPRYVSAFYLPQFHPVPENDAWWGPGYTEWRAVVEAVSAFPGHLQPARPADLGFYDLRLTETMAAQAGLARGAGIDAFCVYHYWFGGRRLLDEPMNRLLARPDLDFPFYLCWANESWRRNWDGLSGEILREQDYAPGFEEALVRSTLPYMADRRYQRPDGRTPRFVIYRPEDMPAPVQNVARMRRAWREAGVGSVELGAVSFHVGGSSDVPENLFDFWIEMPPHGLVDDSAYLFGGSAGNLLGEAGPAPGFAGLIYDYPAVARRSLDKGYRAGLPEKTIAGIMPSWDNSARRRARAHIARGANPATFRSWLRDLQRERLAQSYRGELFINAWNEWGEKAMLEPSRTFGHLYLDILAESTGQASCKPEVAVHG
ncbi:hypothetical protein OB2597_13143 [Pseudooceanicola batsensis HTCC2597]|uniref:Glycosyl transferase family 1 n=2 Tax=Pseudooceanicola batsensis TaxID=314255 RepID=A3TY57_PSEBH|nr:hypothetical protein OB2597_13143 [Pseudooceanicola batsensis HTCC2597]